MESHESLKRKTFSGMIWKLLERILAQGVSLIVSIILARILMPDDYSVVSIVSIFFAFCNMFISSGLSVSLIQKKDSDINDYSTVFYASIVLAIIFYVGMWFAAPYISNMYDKEILVPLIRVMGITFFINAYKAVVCAKISHELKFKKFFFATLIGTVVSAVIGIFMANKGYGSWSLVAQNMSNSIIDSIILTVSTHFSVKLVFSWKILKQHLKFSWKLFIASLITTTYDQIKPLIVGLKYSTTDLAYYNKGDGFPNMINSTISNTMSGVLFPALSKLQDSKEEMLIATRRYIKTASFVIFPMMIGLMAVADNFVWIVLSEKWMAIVPFMRIFCACYMFDLIQVGNLQAIRAMGRTDIILITEIIKKTCYFVIILIFVFFSHSALVFAVTNILSTVVATIVNTFPNRKLLGYSYKYQIIDVLPNLGTSVFMGVCVYLLRFLPINLYYLLIIQIVSGVILYILFNLIIKNENIYYLIGLIRRQKHA